MRGQTTHKLFGYYINLAVGQACWSTDFYTRPRPKHIILSASNFIRAQSIADPNHTLCLQGPDSITSILRIHQNMTENLLKIHLRHPSEYQHLLEQSQNRMGEEEKKIWL